MIYFTLLLDTEDGVAWSSKGDLLYGEHVARSARCVTTLQL